MGPYGMGDTLHIYSVDNTTKAWGVAVPLKAMMVFMIHLYVYIYGFSYLLLN